MTDTTTLPADWAIERALEESGCVTPVADVKNYPKPYRNIIAFARYIEEHEQPPVDPWTLKARELVAGVAKEMNFADLAEDYRAGGCDNDPEVQAIATALLAAFEQGKAA